MKGKGRMLEKNNMTLMLEKMIKNSIAENQISRNELSKKKSLQEKGITLIALVVTIIILLILAGVTLNIALSDNGLFSKTKEAADSYKQAQISEEGIVKQIATQMYSEYVGLEVSGYTPTGDSNCTIETTTSGYTEPQDFNREDMTWKVWDFDGTTLRIIGEPTETKLYLKGLAGYNNGVWALDHICKELYSNGEEGVDVTTIKRSDIQNVCTFDYSNSNIGGDDSLLFGTAKNYIEANSYYPKMWKDNDQYWLYDSKNKKEVEGYRWETVGDGKIVDEGENNEKAVFKKEYYVHDYKKDEFINDKYFDLIFNSNGTQATYQYWLGSRYCGATNNFATFGLEIMSESSNYEPGHWIGGNYLFKSNNTERNTDWSVRPIVSIDVEKCKMNLENESGKTICKIEFN